MCTETSGIGVGRSSHVGHRPLHRRAKLSENLQWMGPDTKAKALEKLSKFGVKIGYPSKWRDYSKLEIREGALVGNAERAGKFQWMREVNRIGKPVDKGEWGMTPQTVNAYYNATKNEVVFPAAILKPEDRVRIW